MSAVKIVIEQHADTFIAYPLGMKGIVVGQGDSYEEALADVQVRHSLSNRNVWDRVP